MIILKYCLRAESLGASTNPQGNTHGLSHKLQASENLIFLICGFKATQIYLIVLPIFFSIGAVGWRQKKKKSDKEVFNFFRLVHNTESDEFPRFGPITTLTYCIIPDKRTPPPNKRPPPPVFLEGYPINWLEKNKKIYSPVLNTVVPPDATPFRSDFSYYATFFLSTDVLYTVSTP